MLIIAVGSVVVFSYVPQNWLPHSLWSLAGVRHQVSKELLVLGDKVSVEEVGEGLIEHQTHAGTV